MNSCSCISEYLRSGDGYPNTTHTYCIGQIDSMKTALHSKISEFFKTTFNKNKAYALAISAMINSDTKQQNLLSTRLAAIVKYNKELFSQEELALMEQIIPLFTSPADREKAYRKAICSVEEKLDCSIDEFLHQNSAVALKSIYDPIAIAAVTAYQETLKR